MLFLKANQIYRICWCAEEYWLYGCSIKIVWEVGDKAINVWIIDPKFICFFRRCANKICACCSTCISNESMISVRWSPMLTFTKIVHKIMVCCARSSFSFCIIHWQPIGTYCHLIWLVLVHIYMELFCLKIK